MRLILKKIMLLFSLLCPLMIFSQGVSLDQLEERDNNTYYLISTGEQYTGPCIGKYPNGQKYEGTFAKGGGGGGGGVFMLKNGLNLTKME